MKRNRKDSPTQAEIDAVVGRYHRMGAAALAQELGVLPARILYIAQELGCKVDPDVIAAQKRAASIKATARKKEIAEARRADRLANPPPAADPEQPSDETTSLQVGKKNKPQFNPPMPGKKKKGSLPIEAPGIDYSRAKITVAPVHPGRYAPDADAPGLGLRKLRIGEYLDGVAA